MSALPDRAQADVSALFLLAVTIDLRNARVIASPAGTRMTFVVTGGTVNGPRVRGNVLPGASLGGGSRFRNAQSEPA